MIKRYIHYGHTNFEYENFSPVKNKLFGIKPIGGLWASSMDAKYPWKEWCKSNQFRECNEDNSFKFTLDESANIIHLYSVDDLKKLPKNTSAENLNPLSWYYIDFEKCVEIGIDAIELHLSEDRSDDLFNGLYYTLYGWDCDSILIMNPAVIITD